MIELLPVVAKGIGSAVGGWLGRVALAVLERRWDAAGLRGVWVSCWVEDGHTRFERMKIDGVTIEGLFGRVDQLDQDGKIVEGLGCHLRGKVEGDIISIQWYRDRKARQMAALDFGTYVLEKRSTTSACRVLAGRAIGVDHSGRPIDAQHLIVPEDRAFTVAEIERIRFQLLPIDPRVTRDLARALELRRVALAHKSLLHLSKPDTA